jgi:butyrate kinase
MPHRILVINPGSTSTKVAVYEGETPIFTQTLRHSTEEISRYARVFDQYSFRRDAVLSCLEECGIAASTLSAVVGRGGVLRPLASGTYGINQRMLDELRGPDILEHASNLGAPIAQEIATPLGIPAFTVDPVAVDEFEDVARVTGLPDIERRSLSHALNLKATARRAAKELGRAYDEINLIVCHLGGGISIAAHRRGRQIDVNNAADAGPFAPERAGTLPLTPFVDLCFSGRYDARELKRLIIGGSGLVAHFGTNSTLEVEKMIAEGNERAQLVYESMAYNIAKEIGAMATVLKGRVDAIVLTGGVANSELLVGWIKERVGFIAPVLVYPGEDEMLALAQGALRVLGGEEEAREYHG